MKISELWLREWVNPPVTVQQLADQLTMAGLEVDSVHPVSGEFTKVVIGHVLQTTPHPQADKLTLCVVDAGLGETLNIVCGASNVRANLRVALALPGAVLPNEIHIKESILRGQLSQGMLCSTSELGLDDQSEGIIELAADAPIGMDVREYLQLDDHVIELDLTPNRADCFSLLGIAREVAVLNRLPFNEPASSHVTPSTEDKLDVTVHTRDACPHYCGRVIRSINPDAITPIWILERLRRGGIRGIHPVVDVINYVMLELGQPMHAFDLSRIKGSINVRYNHPDEQLVLLDGQEVTLNEQVLVISDDEQALGIAGVMGGEFSAVNRDTVDIFIESAYFNPLVIAGVARRFSLSSDSSIRFERGVDPTLQVKALDRVTELLTSIVGGQVGALTECLFDETPQLQMIEFRPGHVRKLTGVTLSEHDMQAMLVGLGFKVNCDQAVWRVQVPLYRFDIKLEVDLVEEIVRIYGYDNIESVVSIAPMQSGVVNKEAQFLQQIRSILSTKGYSEAISYSFVDPQLQSEIYPNAHRMTLKNPISSELSEMRAGLWPGLIASMLYNLNRQQNAIKLFEIGVAFEKIHGEIKERTCISGLSMGEVGVSNWSEPAHRVDFFDIKGDLQALFATVLKKDVSFVQDTHDALHPGQTARMILDGHTIGWLGVLHPKISDAMDIHQDIVLFELFLDEFPLDPSIRYKRISKYPQVRRDLSLLADISVTARHVEEIVKEVVSIDLLKGFDVFDVYTGESIPFGKKSLAIALTMQNDNRTLLDKEINAIIDAILEKLSNNLAITLRE